MQFAAGARAVLGAAERLQAAGATRADASGRVAQRVGGREARCGRDPFRWTVWLRRSGCRSFFL